MLKSQMHYLTPCCPRPWATECLAGPLKHCLSVGGRRIVAWLYAEVPPAPMAQQPLVGQGLLIIEPSRSRAVAQLVEALRYKPEGRGFDSR